MWRAQPRVCEGRRAAGRSTAPLEGATAVRAATAATLVGVAASLEARTCCVSVSHCRLSSCLSARSRSMKARWREILASNWPFAASAFASASAVHVATRRARQLRVGTRAGAARGWLRSVHTLCRLLRGARLLLLQLELGLQLGVLPSQILRRRKPRAARHAAPPCEPRREGGGRPPAVRTSCPSSSASRPRRRCSRARSRAAPASSRPHQEASRTPHPKRRCYRR